MHHSFTFWQSSSAREIRAEAYTNTRNAQHWQGAHPFVDECLIRAPFWQLHLPYLPKYELQLEQLCESLAATRGAADPQPDAFFACFQRYYRIQLNGEPLSGGDRFFQEHGVRHYRTVSGVFPRNIYKPGRNTLRIERGKPEKQKEVRRYYIYVWMAPE